MKNEDKLTQSKYNLIQNTKTTVSVRLCVCVSMSAKNLRRFTQKMKTPHSKIEDDLLYIF